MSLSRTLLPTLLCLAFVLPSSLLAQERYGFIARLGRDTVSIERVVRTGDKIVTDGVDRFPRVHIRHTEILLAADKSVKRMSTDIQIPSMTTPRDRERHVLVEMLRDSLRLTVRNSEGTKSEMVATKGALTMPWASQVYSLFELYFGAALSRKGDTVEVQQFYPDADIGDFPIHHGFVRRIAGGKAEVFNDDMLSGVGEARLDAKHRMLSYSGARSTYRQEVERLATPPDVESIGKQFAAKEKLGGTIAEMSVRDTARATIGKAVVSVAYSRPLVRGRTLLGGIIPYDEVWRTGANASTRFTTSVPLTLAGFELAPGTYSLWTLPSKTGVKLIVNKTWKVWGTQYDKAGDIGRTALKVETAAKLTEAFTISVLPVDAKKGTLAIEWGTFRWTAPITVK